MDQRSDQVVDLAPARALARAVNGDELVVFVEESDLVVGWNGSATFNVYALDGTTVDMWMTETPLGSAHEAFESILDHTRKGDEEG